MNGNSIFLLIDTISRTSSKNEKISMLQKFKDDELLARVLYYTYNPFKNYGLSHAPQPETEGPQDLSMYEPAWVLLRSLIDRRTTGHEALRGIQHVLNQLNAPNAELFRRILNKDMRAGLSESTINKVFKGLLPEFPYMRCTLPKGSNMDKWNWADGIYVQEKADGSFADVNKDAQGSVWVTSRQGSPYPEWCLGIEDEVAFFLPYGTQTHGELTVHFRGVLLPRKEGNGILNSLLQGGNLPEGHHVHFHAWDQIPIEEVAPKGRYEVPYKERYEGLLDQLRHGGDYLHIIPTKVVKSKAEAWDYYREILDQGREGVICKHPLLIWRDTGSSGEKNQVKLKLEFTVELKVVGLVPGKPGKKTADTFGSLLCQSACGKLEVGVSGLTDADRARGSDWIGSIVSVTANDIMLEPEGVSSLFLPRLEEERLDKREADTLDQIKATFEAAKLSA
jgi:DNA ligase-1